MSGFAAIIRFDGAAAERGSADAAAIRRMTAAMDYRGSDGIHHRQGDGFALGHCAFHTTPGAADAPQPWFSADGKSGIVMDGWLANPDELRTELKARHAQLRNGSDAELVLQAYAAWGEDFVDHLEGEYAIVIRDGHRQRVICARDHLGMRPLHYHWDGHRLLVASDLAGVLAAGDFAPALNSGRMLEHLASDFHAREETIWAGVMRLPLASLLVAHAGGLAIREYWSLPLDRTIRYRREADYFEHYRDVLLDSVRRASRSSVAIGCEVSGGHDSSAIFAMARRLHESGDLQAPDALGFTLKGVPGEISDEIEYARDVGRFFGVPIHEAERACADIAWFEQAMGQDRDMPYFPNGQSMYSEAELVRSQGCRVLLDGEGGDEFAGGSAYLFHELLRKGRFGTLRRELELVAREWGLRYAAHRLFRYGLRPFAPMAFDGAMRFLHRHRRPWGEHLGAGPHWVAEPALRQLSERREAARLRDEVWRIRNPSKRRLWRELRDPFFNDLRDTGARLLARLGLENRTPMYSRRYVEFISALPEDILTRDGHGKYVHLQALREDLPQSVLDRCSKADFGFTFQQQLADVADVFEREIPATAPEEICQAGLAKLWERYRANGEGIWELWRVYGWYRLKTMAAHEIAPFPS